MARPSVRRRSLLVVLVAVPILSFAFWSLRARGAADSQTDRSIPAVKVMTARTASDGIILPVSGFIRSVDRADVSPLASGKILDIFKREGDTVRQGEVIAIIDSQQVDAQIDAAGSNIDALQKTLDKSQKYYEQLVKEARSADDNMDTDASNEALKSAKRARDLQIQATRDQLVAAQGMLEVARSGRSDFSVKAPFSGRITAVNGRVGGFASFGMPLFSLSSNKAFEIETYVSAADGKRTAVNNQAAFSLTDGSSVAGTVSAISAGADSQSLKTLVRIQINTAPASVGLGDFLHGGIFLPDSPADISLPQSAIVSRGGDPIVFVVDQNSIVHEQPVRLGDFQNGSVRIESGLTDGQSVVIEGQQYLLNGLSVKPYAD